MSITASGLYGLSIEKMMIDTLGESLEAEDHYMLLVTDTYTPNFDTHALYSDITNQIGAGGGYTTGGTTITTTEVTVASPAAGQLKWDHDDATWAASTITNAMAGIDLTNVAGLAAASNQLIACLDFVTAVSTVSGLLTVQIAANGVFYLDYTP
jgi:hypothetical protein